MGLKSLSEMLVLNLETLSVELLKIFSAKTEHSSGLTFYYLTTGGHISHAWDHVHSIPGEILPHFDHSHLYIAQRDQK